MKQLKWLLSLLLIVTILAGCSAPPPHDAKKITGPNGVLALDLTKKQIEEIAGEANLYMPLESNGTLGDYADYVVVFDSKGYARSIRCFATDATDYYGISVGMSYEDVVAKLPGWQEDVIIMEQDALYLPLAKEAAQPKDVDDIYTENIYRFEDGKLERLIVSYPGISVSMTVEQ